MTYTEILELIRAGYTRAEIDAMQKEELASTAAPADSEVEQEQEQLQEETQEQTKAQNKPKSIPAPDQGAEQTEVQKLISALGLQVQQLTRAVQAHNVTTMESNGASAETADDIIARIINPTK